MTLLIISIPFMLVAVGIAVVPLVAMSHTEARHIAEEFEQHRLAHQAHRYHAHAMHPNEGIDVHILAGSTESLRAPETSLVQGG
jgi:hypothetical protein